MTGRLWMEMRYYDDDGILLTKSPELDMWYKELVKWIKKNVPRQEVITSTGTEKIYISESIKKLVEEEGYSLQ
jgi:hypothetical protein